MDDWSDGLGGLTEFADPDDNLTEGQQPYCPVPLRVEEGPRWGYRWRSYLLFDGNAPPEEYVTLFSSEYRLAGAGSYEITLQEDVAWADAAGVFPLRGTPNLVQAVTGLTRLRVTSGGFGGERFHHGRQTLIVNGEYVFVDVQVPARAAIGLDAEVAAQDAGESAAITIARPHVRVLAVPARSRRPSEWRIADTIFVADVATFPPIRLAPGVSDVRLLGARRFSVAFTLEATGTAASPLTVVTAPENDGWIPTDGASHVGFIAIAATGGTLILEQRGWM